MKCTYDTTSPVGYQSSALRTGRFGLLAVLLLIATLVVYAGKGQTSAERRQLKFSHQLHADNGLDCAACHAAATSKSGGDDLLPKHEACGDCHDVKSDGQCNLCHLKAEPTLSRRITEYSPLFSHERHLSAGKIECQICHANLDGVLDAEQAGHLPTMGECMTCHTTRRVANECRTCHSPSEDLLPRDHKLDWQYRHGAVASAEGTSCKICHATDDCQKCHQGDPVLMPHPRNYVARHGQDAHLSDVSCSACHEQREFCNSCHRDRNVLPSGHLRSGWANRTDGGDHVARASSDLESCMACHEESGNDPVCVNCHGR